MLHQELPPIADRPLDGGGRWLLPGLGGAAVLSLAALWLLVGPIPALVLRGRPAFGSRTMKRGDRGWDVAAMQYILARRGYPPGAIDAIFGPMTDRALRNFQSALGLSADGLAGPATIAGLRHGAASRGTTPVANGPAVSPLLPAESIAWTKTL